LTLGGHGAGTVADAVPRIIGGVRAALDSLAERLLRRPRLARDRILLATSADGIAWTKASDAPIVHPSHRRPHMTYFSAWDGARRLWVRASVFDASEDAWHTEIGHDAAWCDVRELGIRHLYAPSWDGDRVYGVVLRDGEPPRFGAFRARGGGPPAEELESEWEDASLFAVMHDLRVLRDGERLLAWAGVGESDSDVSIHRWESTDGGLRWAHHGVAVESPLHSPSLRLADNPSVVALPDGGWRMFFRTGERPALGNTIRSARSVDLETWEHEDGDRIAPGGRWDTHGVGFPHVWIDDDGEWHMLYAGYWGATRAAAATADHWRAIESY
jgi:hypothetical protein